MKSEIVGIAFMAASAICFAQKTPGDALGNALRAPLPGTSMPNSRLPVYLKAGSLICEKWQRVTSVAEDAARASDAEQNAILRNADCAIVPEDTQVKLIDVDPKSWEGTGLRTYGLAKIWWQESSGINDVGYVGTHALRN